MTTEAPGPDETAGRDRPGPVVPTDQVPTHRRSIEVEVFEAGEELVVVGHLRDTRPWAAGTEAAEHVHDMELAISVRRADLVITAARARMDRFPHVECTDIEGAFGGLVGLSVARGYSRAVQERFGRTLGCTHLELLARTLGPVVIQAIPSSAFRQRDPQRRDGALAAAGTGWIADSCHVWATGGPAMQKLELGWQITEGQYPIPSVVELRRSRVPDGDR